jgi:hypothetical protein|nr:MAG TPA: DNA POLYMERASE [Caudoviricetes sp.]
MNFDQLIQSYPKGSDLVILDATYHFPNKQQVEGYNGVKTVYTPDTMTIVYKDNTTGKKGIEVIENPKYVFYMLKNNIPTPNYDMFFTDMKNLDEITCRYRDINKAIAEKLDQYEGTTKYTDLYKRNVRDGNYKANMDFQKSRRVFGSDIPINDFYRMRFAEQYKNTETPVTRAYLDIEVDVKLSPTDFPTNGNCPINAISYFEHDTKRLFTFLLNQKDVNPKSNEFCSTVDNRAFNKEFKDFLNETLGSEKVKDFKLENIQTKVLVYNDELTLLKDLFGYINYTKPDFLMVWNMSFDIPFIINRIIALGGNPKEIMCIHDISPLYEHCNYIVDPNHEEFSTKGDYADITSYTVYLDQLIQFASRRRGGAQYRSYSLDYIGNEMAGVQKLHYENIADNVMELPYNDYRTFVKYNMMDVLVQYCIEFKADDILYVFDKALLNCTEYKKVHRQTIYLSNRATIMFKNFGNYVLGNNLNKFKPKPTVKYEGAYVADPCKFGDKYKDKVNGIPIMRASNAIDFDFTRLYPSITQEYNMAPNTEIGYIKIPNKIYEAENAIHNEKYTRSGQFIEDMTSECDIEFAHRWFNLASFKEAYADIIEYFNTEEAPFYRLVNDDLLPKQVYNKHPSRRKVIASSKDYDEKLFSRKNIKDSIPESNRIRINSYFNKD